MWTITYWVDITHLRRETAAGVGLKTLLQVLTGLLHEHKEIESIAFVAGSI